MPIPRLATFDHSFGSNKLSQSWHDLWLWEQVLNHFPPMRIYELGTFTGGMAVYLHVQATLRGAEFISFDKDSVEHIRRERPDSFFHSPTVFLFKQLDVLSDEGKAFIGERIQREGQSIVFCDNGHKPDELFAYTRLLKDGDVIAVHDWGTECTSAPEELKLFEVFPGIYEELHSMTRFFVK